MAWTRTATMARHELLQHINAEMKKMFVDLAPGEVFSLNEKSKQFAFIHADPAKDQLVVREALPGGHKGAEISLPLSAYKDRELVIHQAADETADAGTTEKYSEDDRVKHRVHGNVGTVIFINEKKYPDMDIIVRWDEPLNGYEVTETHPGETEILGEKASGEIADLAHKARNFYMQTDSKQDADFVNKIKDEVVKEIKTSIDVPSPSEIIRKELDKAASTLEAEVISSFAVDLKPITHAGMLSVTAGAYNYEIDHLSDLMGDYYSTVLNKVAMVTKSYDLQPIVTEKILRRMAQSVLDGYFLTREGYIRRHKGRWGVFSKKGKLLGTHPSKEKAQAQLRAIEWRKRQGTYEELS